MGLRFRIPRFPDRCGPAPRHTWCVRDRWPHAMSHAKTREEGVVVEASWRLNRSFPSRRSSSRTPRRRRSSWRHETSRVGRVPVQTHSVEPLDRLLDQFVIPTRVTECPKSERLNVHPRLQERRRYFLDLGPSLEGNQSVESRDRSFDIQEPFGAPLAQPPLDLT